MGASSWAAEYLNRHPILLDELLDPRLADTATDWTGFAADLDQTWPTTPATPSGKWTSQRETHHAQLFRLLAQDLAGLHSIERISDHLTELADIIVAKTPPCAGASSRTGIATNPALPSSATANSGQGTGLRLDLDLVYLFDDDAQGGHARTTPTGQRLNTWLSSQTSAGILFRNRSPLLRAQRRFGLPCGVRRRLSRLPVEARPSGNTRP